MPLGASFFGSPRSTVARTQGRPIVLDACTALAGGLNTISADDALQPNQFRRGDNGRLTPFGAFIKRGGTQRTAAALIVATTVQNGYGWDQASGAVLTLAVCGGTLFTTTYGSFPLTWTQRGSTAALSTTVPPSITHFIETSGAEAAYIADGGLLNKLVGTSLTTNISSTPNSTILCVHNERLWSCGDPSFPDSIWYSDLNNGDTLGIGASAGGQIVVRTFGSQNVTTLASLGTSLLIFHTKGLSRLTGYGQSDVTVSPAGISRDIGTTSPFSPVVVDNLCFFVSERGLYAATEADVQPVSSPAQPDPLSAILPLMTSTDIANIRCALNRATRELEIWVPGYGLFVYHTILKAWAGPWTDGYLSPNTNCLFETNNASGYPIVLRGDVSGFVSETDRPNVGLDNVAADGTGGTSYLMTLQFRRFYCNDPMTAKAWRFGYLLASLNGSNAATVSWVTDSTADSERLPVSLSSTWGAAGTTWGAGTWGASNQISYRVQLDGNGYYLDLTVTDSSSSIPVISQSRIQGFALGRR